MQDPYNGHPNPHRYRPDWFSLNGSWDFTFDAFSVIKLRTNPHTVIYDQVIQVPFVYQSSRSGIARQDYYPYVWYRKRFSMPEEWQDGKSTCILHFGAVDYEARVWFNGELLGGHSGGHTPFHFIISSHHIKPENEIVVRVYDPLDPAYPRGKQSFSAPFECWYTPSTGIWQPVWIERAGSQWIEALHVCADYDTGNVRVELTSGGKPVESTVELNISRNETNLKTIEKRQNGHNVTVEFPMPEALPWSPESPVLYEMEITLRKGEAVQDRLSTYFAFRSITVRDNRVFLNGEPLYQRFILDQGYWPESLITPPDEDSLIHDIEIAQSIGMNGCRKHLKIEDPRFLYWADVKGYLVWAEAPSFYQYTPEACRRFEDEWYEALKRDMDHPCIIAWVLFNESWGIPDISSDPDQLAWVKQVIQKTRDLDPSRLLISNDGWEHIDSDLATIHSYAPDADTLGDDIEAYITGRKASNGMKLWIDSFRPARLPPLVVTEFGGTAYSIQSVPDEAWGYNREASSPDDFRIRISQLMDLIYRRNDIQGFVYTQLTDVQQEINGLFTCDRKPKIPVDTLRSLFSGK